MISGKGRGKNTQALLNVFCQFSLVLKWGARIVPTEPATTSRGQHKCDNGGAEGAGAEGQENLWVLTAEKRAGQQGEINK